MKTLIEIDDEKLAAAAQELGTKTKKDTVSAALDLAIARGTQATRQVKSVYDFWGEDITDPEVMKQARR